MLCSRFLKPPGETARTRSTALRRRSSRACAISMTGACAACMRHRVLTMSLPPARWWPPSICYGLVPKGFIPNQDTGPDFRAPPKRRRTSRSTPWSGTSSRWPTILADDPNIEALLVERRAAAAVTASGNTGRIFMRLKPREQPDSHAGAGDRATCGPSSTPSPASASTCRIRR